MNKVYPKMTKVASTWCLKTYDDEVDEKTFLKLGRSIDKTTCHHKELTRKGEPFGRIVTVQKPKNRTSSFILVHFADEGKGKYLDIKEYRDCANLFGTDAIERDRLMQEMSMYYVEVINPTKSRKRDRERGQQDETPEFTCHDVLRKLKEKKYISWHEISDPADIQMMREVDEGFVKVLEKGLMDTQQVTSVIPVYEQDNKLYPLGGIHLLKALKELSKKHQLPETLKKIQVDVYSSLTDDEKKEICLLDNNRMHRTYTFKEKVSLARAMVGDNISGQLKAVIPQKVLGDIDVIMHVAKYNEEEYTLFKQIAGSGSKHQYLFKAMRTLEPEKRIDFMKEAMASSNSNALKEIKKYKKRLVIRSIAAEVGLENDLTDDVIDHKFSGVDPTTVMGRSIVKTYLKDQLISEDEIDEIKVSLRCQVDGNYIDCKDYPQIQEVINEAQTKIRTILMENKE